jgi:hypothetical protein
MAALYSNDQDMTLETRKAVAKKIGITQRTFRTWLTDEQWAFEELLEEATRGKS